MSKKIKSIPVNPMASGSGIGIAIERVAFTGAMLLEEGERPHRHDGHAFFLLEQGSISIEIDFEKYIITAPSVMYVHPDQVHRTIASQDVIVNSLAITNENIKPEYLALLEDIAPAKPLTLQAETFAILIETVSLSIKFAERKTDKLYQSLLTDSGNALIALVISQYLAQAEPIDKLSRFELVTKNFRAVLERNYTKMKSPAAYAQKLNLSAPYLNECVKNASGYSVSHHVQQRIILEAKRLLSHSDKSVKQIAAELGYDDYPYFSRLFTKVAGMSALAFRNKNFD